MSDTTGPTIDPQALLDVVAEEHLREWVELVQLRALVKQQTRRIGELEQAVRDAANLPVESASADTAA